MACWGCRHRYYQREGRPAFRQDIKWWILETCWEHGQQPDKCETFSRLAPLASMLRGSEMCVCV